MLEIIVLISLIWLFLVLPLLALFECVKSKSLSKKSKVLWGLGILCVPALGAVSAWFFVNSKPRSRKVSIVSGIVFILIFGLAVQQVIRAKSIYSELLSLTNLPDSEIEDRIYESENKIDPAKNAATFYIKAIDSLQYAPSDQLKKLIKNIRIGKWVKDKELIALLNSNQRSLLYLEKAIQLPGCDFYFGKRYEYAIEKNIFNVVPLVNLSRVIVLKGKMLESQKKYSSALAQYLKILVMGLHLSKEEENLSKVVGMVLVNESLSSLGLLVNENVLGREDQHKIKKSLLKYKNNVPNPSSLYLLERESFLSSIAMLVDGMDSINRLNKSSSEKWRNEDLDLFSNAFRKYSLTLADQHFGNFAKAADSNLESDWNFAQKEIDSLRNGFRSKLRFAGRGPLLVYFRMVKNHQRFYDLITEMETETIIQISIPEMRKAVNRHHENRKLLDRILVKVN